MNFLAIVKKILSKYLLLNSYCKICGREIRDFIAPSDIWNKVEPHIPNNGHVLCYNCFCDICLKIGISPIWKLESYK